LNFLLKIQGTDVKNNQEYIQNTNIYIYIYIEKCLLHKSFPLGYFTLLNIQSVLRSVCETEILLYFTRVHTTMNGLGKSSASRSVIPLTNAHGKKISPSPSGSQNKQSLLYDSERAVPNDPKKIDRKARDSNEDLSLGFRRKRVNLNPLTSKPQSFRC